MEIPPERQVSWLVSEYEAGVRTTSLDAAGSCSVNRQSLNFIR
jgi:hypothetical protein